MLGVILIVLVLFVLIIGHELAHFLVARLFGLQTPVFGFGLPFGPSWLIGIKWDTQFRIHLLPFGGYVSIPELDPETSEEGVASSLSKPFRKFPIWQRVLVVLAGVGFYTVFAWLVLFASLNCVGEPKQLVVVSTLSSDNPIAANAGVKPGDQVVTIDSKQVSSSEEIVSYLRSHPATSVTLGVVRQEQPLDLSITTNAGGKVGMVLVSKWDRTAGFRPIAFLESFGLATQKLYTLTIGMLGFDAKVIGNMLPQPVEKQSAGVHYVRGGMIGIAPMAANIASEDWRQLPQFVAILSVAMAIANLMPWPGFDGSHLIAIVFNAARGKPLTATRPLRWAFVGVLVLMLLCGAFPMCLLRGSQKRSGR